VLYGEEERAAVEVAAELAGLRTSGYVAVAVLVMAQQVQEPTEPGEGGGAGGPRVRRVSLSSPEDRELLAELIQARLALRRFGVNVNQAAAVLNSGGQVPVWLEQAVAGGDRAVARVDRAAVARRLGWAPAAGGDRSGAAARQLGAGVAVLRVHRGPGGRGGTGERAHATPGHRWLGRRGRAGGAAATGVRRRPA